MEFQAPPYFPPPYQPVGSVASQNLVVGSSSQQSAQQLAAPVGYDFHAAAAAAAHLNNLHHHHHHHHHNAFMNAVGGGSSSTAAAANNTTGYMTPTNMVAFQSGPNSTSSLHHQAQQPNSLSNQQPQQSYHGHHPSAETLYANYSYNNLLRGATIHMNGEKVEYYYK